MEFPIRSKVNHGLLAQVTMKIHSVVPASFSRQGSAVTRVGKASKTLYNCFTRIFTMQTPTTCLGRAVLVTVGLCAIILFGGASAAAEQLPTRVFTTADGLARDQIVRIVQDSKGFLWFCTVEGLSRFDGVRFSNYSMTDGLPAAVISDILLSSNGTYWVATRAGLRRFNPLGVSRTRQRKHVPGTGTQATQPMFETCAPDGERGDGSESVGCDECVSLFARDARGNASPGID